jgi:hypothetical protein
MFPLDRGVNSLIGSLRAHGIEPNQNVYASLDGVWAELMIRPVEAAHVIGELLKYVGEPARSYNRQRATAPRSELQQLRC